ncbi:hypothetical protein LX32DRAFT_686320 [Colletotrichum zoysiae]|uniref:Uncharacterized protein n=1 Tax=Colletotrichum zoysiae TaxID=1216348 RepID=A0AAD9H7L4_9PEZI|nr:hypothetical protein LX32DRAFT_686320 [Colletotrichum zoysiae]
MHSSGVNSTAHQPTPRRGPSRAGRPTPANPSSESAENTPLYVAVEYASQAIHKSETVLAGHWHNIRIAFIDSGITTPFADWLTQAFGNHDLITIVRAAFATSWRQVQASGSREAGRRRSAAKRLGLDGIWELYLWFGASVRSQRCWRLLPQGSEISARQLFIELCRVREQQRPLGKQKHHLEAPFRPREFELACRALTGRETTREPETRDDRDKKDSRKQHKLGEERTEQEREQEQVDDQEETSKTGHHQHRIQDDNLGYFDDTLDSESEIQYHEDDSGFCSDFDSVDMGAQGSSGTQKRTPDGAPSPEEPSTHINDAQTSEMAQRLSAAKSKLAAVQRDCDAKKSQWEGVADCETSTMLECKQHIDARVTLIMEEDTEDSEQASVTDKGARSLGDLERDLKAAVSKKRKASRQIESLRAKSQRLKDSEETMLALFDKAVEDHLGRMRQEQQTIVGPEADRQ